MNRGSAGAIRPRYPELNVDQARPVIREWDIERAEGGLRHYQAGLTKVKAEIAALAPEERGLLPNLSTHQSNLEYLLDAARQRVAELEQALAVGRNLEKFRREGRMSIEQLAAAVTAGDAKAVRQHIKGERQMRLSTQQDYESVLSSRLKRPIRLDQTR